ncbi:MAG: lytic transglycosylase domain-containing protein [Candidatus Aminicenantes bacterium]|nr:lytic transglycosylase domain-containing protein [Candidatus Aminicenantes bacterium]
MNKRNSVRCKRKFFHYSIFLFALLSVLPTLLLSQDIVIKYDKSGNKVITNNAYSPHKIYFKKPAGGKKKSSTSGSVQSVPREYLNKIRKLAAKYGLKEKLIIAVARAESSFNPNAVSKKGAVGLMQLMKSTAKQYGVKNRYDPHQNLEAGVKHLSYLYKKYRYNLPLTLAAYNAGEEAVRKYSGVPPYKETKTYIKRVMKYMGRRYSGYFGSSSKSGIFKIVTKDGRVIITDTMPDKVNGKVTVID